MIIPGKNLPSVSIVIPVFNEEQHLHSCLTSLMRLRYAKECYEILLIDNGSTDRTVEIAQKFNRVSIYVKEHVKVGAVRNYGVDKAQGDVIVFLDSDCVVDQEWLARGVRLLFEMSDSVIGGQYLLREDPSWLERYWMLKSKTNSVRQNSLVGGCIFIWRETFEAVDGFNERLNAGEDSELTERLRGQNFNVVIESSLSVVHLGNPSRIKPFIARQLWHSSDYINGLPGTLRDKTFLLTMVFLIGVFSFVASIILSSGTNVVMISSLSLVLLCPATLTFKRLARAEMISRSVFDYLSIYIVDWLYLIGRALGTLSGIKNLIFLKPNDKVSRR